MTIKDSQHNLSGILAGVVLLLAGATACTVDPLVSGASVPDSGDRSALRLEMGVASTEVGIRTRALMDDDLSEAFASSPRVNSLWVGVFDVQTGDLVGKMHQKTSETDKKGGYDYDNGKGTASVDILYYDAHPTIRIFGVANYEGVTDPEGESLTDRLGGVKSLADFYGISVSAESANAAAVEAPLMVGVYMEAAQAHGRYAVDATLGPPYSTDKNQDNTIVELNDASVEHMYDRLNYTKLTGMIRLRRLLSQINVKVVPGRDNITISNLEYRLVNMPKAVYLQERKTVDKKPGAGDFLQGETAEDWWKRVSPNKADTMDEGYFPATDFRSTENELSFRFYQYENKHWGWGLTDATATYHNRDVVRKGNEGLPIFTALCGDGEDNDWTFNNGASYFEIKMDVEIINEGLTQIGKGVTYRIHEGYSSYADGSEISSTTDNPKDGEKSYDFTCIRNAEYSYTITVSGLDGIDLRVTKDQSGVIDGDLWEFSEDTFREDDLYPAEVHFSGKIVDYVFFYANGGDPIVFGNKKDSRLFQISDLQGVEWKDDYVSASPFKIGGKTLPEIDQPVVNGVVEFEELLETIPEQANPKNYRYELYVLTEDLTKSGTYAYRRFTYLPKDTRTPLAKGVSFELAFANEWDAEATTENGVVAGHIKEISVPKISLDGKQEGVEPVYTLYLGGEEIYRGSDLTEIAKQNLFAKRPVQYEAMKTYPVTVYVSDFNDSFSDIYAELEFLVYPTTISWSNFSTTQPVDGNFYGAYGAKAEFDTNGYLNLQLAASNYQSWVNGYVQTGGSDKHCFDINPLYDGVITIVASNTGNSVNRDVDGEENRWKGMVGRYLSVVDGAGNEQISFASRANTTRTPYTFHVKKGDKPIEIWTSKSLNIYSISFTAYADPSYTSTHVWNFNMGDWPYIGDELGRAPKDNDPGTQTATTIEYVGLRVEVIDTNAPLKFATDGGSTTYPNYFQYANRTQQISFVVDKPGTVSVVASATNDKQEQSDRKVLVQVGENETSPEELDAGDIDKKKQKPLTYEVTGITEPTRIYIYMKNGGLNIYSIEYKEN